MFLKVVISIEIMALFCFNNSIEIKGDERWKITKQQATTIEVMSNELVLLREQVAYLTQKLYGKSSEKLPQMSGQLSLFEEDGLSEEESDLPS